MAKTNPFRPFRTGTFAAPDGKPMVVGALKELLAGLPPEMPIEMSIDEESNAFNHLLQVDITMKKVTLWPDNAMRDPIFNPEGDSA